jgi:hypothetical protein
MQRKNGWYTQVDRVGSFREHYQEGRLHREDGPACIFPDGTQMWYVHGELSREDGPAIVCGNGYTFWALNGRLVDREDVLDTPDKVEQYILNQTIERLSG